MFQLLYIGHNRGAKVWQRKAAMHASRLGLHSHNIQWMINPGRQVLFTSIDHGCSVNPPVSAKIASYSNGVILKQEHNRWLLSPCENQEDYYQAVNLRDMEGMWIAIDQDAQHLCVWCGIVAVDQLYYHRTTEAIIIGNDLRLFASGDTNDLDPVGFHSLFHFGALSAPFTIFKNAKRVPPGYLLKFSSPDFLEDFTPHLLEDFRAHLSASFPSETILENTLMTEIDKVPADSGLFFSGGVDSGLLAALAKRRERYDLHLINCDFSASLKAGITDSEAELARDMAAHLGYKLNVHSFDISLVAQMLEKIGDEYTFPFSDYSTIAQNQLVHYTKGILKPGSWVIDGTGADGIFFDSYPLTRMGRLYQIPRTIRKLIARWYRYEKISSGNGMLSELMGTINESLKVPLMQLIVLSTNKLSGYAFLEHNGILAHVLQTQKSYIETLLQPFDNRMRLSLLDLLWICTGIFAAKGFNPLRSCGLQPFFPFLSEETIGAGAAIMKAEQHLHENKRALKALLLRDVPYEMIYRPKSGFKPPLTVILRNHKVREYINDIILVKDNPVNEFVYYSIVNKLFRRIWNGERIGKHHLSFIWAYMFGSIWLKRQFESCCRTSAHIS